jgi:hypothetical protein
MNLRVALGMAPRGSFDECEPTKRVKIDQDTTDETTNEAPTLTKTPSDSGSDRFNADTNETSKPILIIECRHLGRGGRLPETS